MSELILGCSLGKCVHVAGVYNFLRLAEDEGYQTRFLGPAVSVEKLFAAVEKYKPEIVAVGYRLTPETGYKVLKKLREEAINRGLEDLRYLFGGTAPVAREAEKLNFFEAIFDGNQETEEIVAFLRGEEKTTGQKHYGDNLLQRYNYKKPLPLLRHHFGLPTVEATIAGIEKIAASKILDIISLGPDQNAQAAFFRPQEIDETETGAGGVPIRTESDLENIHEATRCGNYPLIRCYSGTRDVFQMADMLLRTINNAWAAVPLTWYNKMDGRGPRSLLTSISENQKLMRWHGDRKIPVEVNESHHWSIRDAHDTIAVVMAYLAAYNAKKMGVNTYLAQYMFNNPPTTSTSMDLAKMMAKKELISSLQDKDFRVLTQVRAGLASFPVSAGKAKGQLAYSTFVSMALQPDIVHVVGFSEADHAATAEDVIESCHIAKQVIEKGMYGYPDMKSDHLIQQRKQELLTEAKILLQVIKDLGRDVSGDPLIDPTNLIQAVKTGLLDAPHLKGNSEARGILTTKMVNGACYAYDYDQQRILNEEERIERLGLSQLNTGKVMSL